MSEDKKDIKPDNNSEEVCLKVISQKLFMVFDGF